MPSSDPHLWGNLMVHAGGMVVCSANSPAIPWIQFPGLLKPFFSRSSRAVMSAVLYLFNTEVWIVFSRTIIHRRRQLLLDAICL
jgi:hypothetical protein